MGTGAAEISHEAESGALARSDTGSEALNDTGPLIVRLPALFFSFFSGVDSPRTRILFRSIYSFTAVPQGFYSNTAGSRQAIFFPGNPSRSPRRRPALHRRTPGLGRTRHPSKTLRLSPGGGASTLLTRTTMRSRRSSPTVRNNIRHQTDQDEPPVRGASVEALIAACEIRELSAAIVIEIVFRVFS